MFDAYIKLCKNKLSPANTQFNILADDCSQVDDIHHGSCIGGEDFILASNVNNIVLLTKKNHMKKGSVFT